MDTVTHALSGALALQAFYPKPSVGLFSQQIKPGVSASHLTYRAAILVGLLAAAFPDADAISGFFGILAYLNIHRGITHSVVMIPVWAFCLSWLFSLLFRQRYDWKAFLLPTSLALGVHIIADVITAYGTMIWSPFNDLRASWPVTFIIDLYFSGIILTALLLGVIFRKKAPLIGKAGLLILCGYIGFQAVLRHQALEIGEQYTQEQGMENVIIEALPQPVSPFNWKLVVTHKDTYHISYLNLWRKHRIELMESEKEQLIARVDALYQPADVLKWHRLSIFGGQEHEKDQITTAWNSDKLKDIRRFMDYPALSRVSSDGSGFCAWFADQRFILDGIRTPFLFGVCRKTVQADWQLFRSKDNKIIPVE
ncbi:MAG: metal-dependent hydrolase [Gammaproteobacteria bacterium]|nr:metal-dependent hydrolase [Gammaproteobacteria bacterium]